MVKYYIVDCGDNLRYIVECETTQRGTKVWYFFGSADPVFDCPGTILAEINPRNLTLTRMGE